MGPKLPAHIAAASVGHGRVQGGPVGGDGHLALNDRTAGVRGRGADLRLNGRTAGAQGQSRGVEEDPEPLAREEARLRARASKAGREARVGPAHRLTDE